jgi:hypothetical protein
LTIVELLTHPGLRPFEIAVGLVAALLVIEIVANQLGLSFIGDADSDIDLDVDVDIDFDVLPDPDVDMFDSFSSDGEIVDIPSETGLLSWLGIGSVPMIIWLAGVLTAFGLVGYFLQLAISSVFGSPINASIASILAIFPALILGNRSAKLIGKIFPKNLSTAIALKSYGKRRGVITVGTARQGKPAQARFVDGHGNYHYAMVVPMDAAEEITQGSDVAIFRGRDGVLKAIKISD